MSITTALREQLALANISFERFREVLTRLLAQGVIVRDEDRTEQQLYDDARRVQALLSDYFDVAGLYLHHDVNFQFFRLYAPGAVVDGLPEDTHEPVPPNVRLLVAPPEIVDNPQRSAIHDKKSIFQRV